MTTSTIAVAREAVLLRLPVEPGWRLCDADPLEDFEVTGRVAAICETLTAVAVRGDALRVRMFSDNSIRLVPLRSSGKPCSSLACFYDPSDKRPADEILSGYIESLRAGPLPVRVKDELTLLRDEAVPEAAATEQAQRVVCTNPTEGAQ